MEIIINKMLERINFKIRFAQENFTEWNTAHERRMAEIDGMVDMLTIATGKDYVITENGLEENGIVEIKEIEEDEDHYTPSSTNRDYGHSNPWDAPGMSIKDFI